MALAAMSDLRPALDPVAAAPLPAGSSASTDEAGVEPIESLTGAVVAGDRDAYMRLFRLRCEFVEREAMRRVGRRRDLAEDAAQEAWIRIARGPRRCLSQAELDGWLRRIVASCAIDLLRSELSRAAREERIARSREEAHEFLADVDWLAGLRDDEARLAAVDGEARALLELKARTGATLTQLASILGLGRAAVDSRLRRAAAEARAALDGTLDRPTATRSASGAASGSLDGADR
jgi:RNA polymerase sigma factor (sigma-70 family)